MSVTNSNTCSAKGLQPNWWHSPVECRYCGRCQPCALTCVASDSNMDLHFSLRMPPFTSIFYPGSSNTRSYVGICGETSEFRCLSLSWLLLIMSVYPVRLLSAGGIDSVWSFGGGQEVKSLLPTSNKAVSLTSYAFGHFALFLPHACFLIRTSILWMSELSFSLLVQQVLDSVLYLSIPCFFWDILRHHSCLLVSLAALSPVFSLPLLEEAQFFSPTAASACPMQAWKPLYEVVQFRFISV